MIPDKQPTHQPTMTSEAEPAVSTVSTSLGTPSTCASVIPPLITSGQDLQLDLSSGIQVTAGVSSTTSTRSVQSGGPPRSSHVQFNPEVQTFTPSISQASGPQVSHASLPSVPSTQGAVTNASGPLQQQGSAHDKSEVDLLFSQLRRRGKAVEDLLNRVSNSLMQVVSSPVPTVMIARVKGHLEDAERRVREFETSYHQYIRHLKPPEHGAAMFEMNDIIQRYEANISNYGLTLEDYEIQVMQSKAESNSVPAPVTVVGDKESRPNRRVFLERTKLPIFSGKVEEWPDFAKQWKELTKDEGFPDVIALSKLRDCIPMEGKELLVGVESLTEAWERLARRFGDRKIGILTVQKRLNTLVLNGEDYDKIEKLAREVDRAQNLLRSLGAPNQLTQDFEMVGRLVAKLPRPYQTEWDRHVTRPSVISMENTD